MKAFSAASILLSFDLVNIGFRKDQEEDKKLITRQNIISNGISQTAESSVRSLLLLSVGYAVVLYEEVLQTGVLADETIQHREIASGLSSNNYRQSGLIEKVREMLDAA